MAWQIPFFQTLIYATLYSSIAVCILMIYRKIFGKKLRPYARMLLWYGIIILIIFNMTLFKKGNFLRGYHSPDIQIPPIEIAFERLDKLITTDGINLLKPTGHIRMRIINYTNIKSYSFNGNIVLHIVFLIWLLGIVIILFRYGKSYLQLKHKLMDYSVCEEKSIVEIVIKEARSLGADTPEVKLVPQRYFEEIITPCVVGFNRPVLLLIKEQWEQLDDEEKYTVIIHEIMHIYHFDNFLNLLLVILYSIQWFNPFIYFGFKLLRQDLECLRDRQILKRLPMESRFGYASAILKIVTINSKKYLNTLHSGMLLSSGLGFRVELLVDKKRKVILREIIAILFLLILMAIMIFSKYTIGFISNTNVII